MSFSPASGYNKDALLLWQGSKSRNNFVAIGIRDQNVEFSMFSDFSISVPLKYEQGISKLTIEFVRDLIQKLLYYLEML